MRLLPNMLTFLEMPQDPNQGPQGVRNSILQSISFTNHLYLLLKMEICFHGDGNHACTLVLTIKIFFWKTTISSRTTVASTSFHLSYKTSTDIGFLSTAFTPSQAVQTRIILYLGLRFLIELSPLVVRSLSQKLPVP